MFFRGSLRSGFLTAAARQNPTGRWQMVAGKELFLNLCTDVEVDIDVLSNGISPIATHTAHVLDTWANRLVLAQSTNLSGWNWSFSLQSQSQ